VTVCELGIQLERGLGEHVLDVPGEGRFERHREELGCVGRLLVSERRHPLELFAKRGDVTIDLHGCSMTAQ
jgi:hypothetical protein